MRKSIIASVIATAFLSFNAGASDLLQIYKEALVNDAQFSAARATKLAGQERSVQGRSAFLPRVGLTGSVSKSRSEFDPDVGATVKSTTNGNTMTLSLSQPLFNLGAWESYEQSKLSVSYQKCMNGKSNRSWRYKKNSVSKKNNRWLVRIFLLWC